MNKLLLVWLSLSLSGSLVALTILLLKPLLKRFSKTWQYYLWLLVIFRLLIPFSPDNNIIGSLFQQAKAQYAISNRPVEELPEINYTDSVPTDTLSDLEDLEDLEYGTTHKLPAIVTKYSFVKNHLFGTIWLAVAILLLIRKIYGYRQFIKTVISESKIVVEGEISAAFEAAKNEMRIRKVISVCTNPLVRSPLQIGILKPMIVLPVKSIDKAELIYIFRHELTHYLRMDLLYKWLVELALCLHWFNPLAYWVRKQINQDCEFSCDEMVIEGLGAIQRKAYGETLLNSIVITHSNEANIISLSLNEDSKRIKERLCAIMQYQKKSKFIVFVATTLTTVLFCATVYAGSYTVTSPIPLGQNTNQPFQSNTQTFPSIVYENVEMRQYEGKDGHPYVHDIKINNTDKKIIGCQHGMLAFDKDGNPLKIDWWSLDTELDNTYFYLHSTDSTELAPAKTSDAIGGWSLNFYGNDLAVDQIAYVLYCDKEIVFEDGTVWNNPDFQKWLDTYEGKKIDINVLDHYYPYTQEITF